MTTVVTPADFIFVTAVPATVATSVGSVAELISIGVVTLPLYLASALVKPA